MCNRRSFSGKCCSEGHRGYLSVHGTNCQWSCYDDAGGQERQCQNGCVGGATQHWDCNSGGEGGCYGS